MFELYASETLFKIVTAALIVVLLTKVKYVTSELS